MRRDAGLGCISRGNKYGASVSNSNCWAGIRGNNALSSRPRRSSQTQPVIPIDKPNARQESNSSAVPVKQCTTAAGILSSQGESRVMKRSCASRQCRNTGKESSAAKANCAVKATSCSTGVEKLRLKSRPHSPMATTLTLAANALICCSTSVCQLLA
ncbi:Uncharacterised protein [Yersinia enterocolitica]|nr:Uncharacterised protein [Yersinia enterocolitica]